MTDASTFFPGALYQNPDGSFSLDITGHVHAAGLDLDASTITTPPTIDRIQWKRTTDGALVADIIAFNAGGVSSTKTSAYATSPSEISASVNQAVDDTGTVQASVYAEQISRGLSAVVNAQASSHELLIVNELGKSAFVQVGAAISPVFSALGTARVTWPGGNPSSNTTTVGLPGASGVVNGIATPVNVRSDFGNAFALRAVPNGGGGCIFQLRDPDFANPAAGVTCDFAYLIWGG